MGQTLTGQTVQTTYDALIKVGDNTAVDGTLKSLSDGFGNDIPVSVSTSGMSYSGTQDFTAATVVGITNGTSGTSGTSGSKGERGVGYISLFSSTSQTVTTGLKTFTLNLNGISNVNQISWKVDDAVTLTYNFAGQIANMNGKIQIASGSTIVVNVSSVSGSTGTFNNWSFGPQVGTSGTDGTSGTSGTNGITGTSGTSGTSGIDGSAGTSGTDGAAGTSGTSGSSGVSGGGGSTGGPMRSRPWVGVAYGDPVTDVWTTPYMLYSYSQSYPVLTGANDIEFIPFFAAPGESFKNVKIHVSTGQPGGLLNVGLYKAIENNGVLFPEFVSIIANDVPADTGGMKLILSGGNIILPTDAADGLYFLAVQTNVTDISFVTWSNFVQPGVIANDIYRINGVGWQASSFALPTGQILTGFSGGSTDSSICWYFQYN